MIKIFTISLIFLNCLSHRIYHHNYSDIYKQKRHKSDTYKQSQRQENLAKAFSGGDGETGAQISEKGSSSSAKGDKRARAYTNYQDYSNNYRLKNRKGRHTNKRNLFKHQNRINTTGEAEAYKNGFARSISNNEGSKIIAKGDEGSKGSTSQVSHHKVYRNSFFLSNRGGKEHEKKREFKRDFESEGRTNSVVHGKGALMAYSNRWKGSASRARGSKGTHSKANYKKKEKRFEDNFERNEKDFEFANENVGGNDFMGESDW